MRFGVYTVMLYVTGLFIGNDLRFSPDVNRPIYRTHILLLSSVHDLVKWQTIAKKGTFRKVKRDKENSELITRDCEIFVFIYKQQQQQQQRFMLNYLSIYLSICLAIYLSISPSLYFLKFTLSVKQSLKAVNIYIFTIIFQVLASRLGQTITVLL